MRKVAVLFFAFSWLVCSLQAINDALRFRIYLTDKTDDAAGLGVVELSTASRARRERQGIALDSSDYRLSKRYLTTIRSKGYSIVSTSRWLNTVVISAADSSCLAQLKSLPFIKEIRLVWVNPQTKADPVNPSRKAKSYRADSVNYYGMAANQVEMLGLRPLHDKGFKGAGKTIAVIDAGFIGVDSLSWFKELTLIATRDFVYPTTSIYQGHTHGTSVLSLMATQEPYTLVGTAPEASYCLLRSEEVATEFPIEEDYWVEAAEFADSLGVDIISSSLGYTNFEQANLSYGKASLDGKTSFISQGAGLAAGKGMLVVSSAGNDGNAAWSKIGFPADAEKVLTVGSVTTDLLKSDFSSIGPTADGRIKPDVMAMGTQNTVVSGNGSLSKGSGTSYSAPLIAGMAASIWSAFPDIKATELMRCIKESGDRAAKPDSLFGYGVPNAQKIWVSLRESLPQSKMSNFYCYPNPVKNNLYFADFSIFPEPVKVTIYNTFGFKILEKTIQADSSMVDMSDFPDSIYMVHFQVGGKGITCQKIVKQS